MSQTKQTLSLPSAIITGAIIIAVGIVIAFTGGSSGQNQGTGESVRLSIEDAAKKARLRAADIVTCVDNDETLTEVQADINDALSVGIQSTPSNIIIGPGGRMMTISGAYPRTAWDQAIDALMNGTELPASLSERIKEGVVDISPVTKDDHIRGNMDAPITIVEFSDIDCPYCHSLHPTLVQLLADNPNKIRWVYRHLPLQGLHPEALSKAQATECVAAQTDNDTFWKYLDLLILGKTK